MALSEKVAPSKKHIDGFGGQGGGGQLQECQEKSPTLTIWLGGVGGGLVVKVLSKTRNLR
jgi:hypothetical protein